MTGEDDHVSEICHAGCGTAAADRLPGETETGRAIPGAAGTRGNGIPGEAGSKHSAYGYRNAGTGDAAHGTIGTGGNRTSRGTGAGRGKTAPGSGEAGAAETGAAGSRGRGAAAGDGDTKRTITEARQSPNANYAAGDHRHSPGSDSPKTGDGPAGYQSDDLGVRSGPGFAERLF